MEQGLARIPLIYLAFILTSVILTISTSASLAGPRAFLYENVRADFDADGTYSSDTFSPCTENPCAAGYMKVSVPNSDDVLQYLRINVTNTTDTNLYVMEFFRDTLTSYPTANTTQTVNCNTTNSATGTWYNVTNHTLAPDIQINFTITNLAGGNDTTDDE